MCDISDYQTQYSAIAYRRAGRRAIMIKACEDCTLDGAWNHRSRVRQSHVEGLHVVHYAYLHPSSGEQQGLYLCDRVECVWKDGDVLCADIEMPSMDERVCAEVLDGWLAALRSRGHEEPIGYSGEAFLNERKLGPAIPHGWIVANYGKIREATARQRDAAGGLVLGRQFTDGEAGAGPHTCAGISGPVDCTLLTEAGEERILRHG
jgi:hypothetical protein